MHGELSLVTTIAVALGAALLLGFLALRLKLPAIVGYLVAGVLIGPATPGFVADVGLAQQLSEIGVMLLMFGVGLHFSLDDLKEVRGIALPGALGKIALATLLGMACGHASGVGRPGPAWSSAWRSPWPAPSCSCAPSRTADCSTR